MKSPKTKASATFNLAIVCNTVKPSTVEYNE